MLEELAFLNGSRLMRLAGICYTAWALFGVLFRGWSVGEVFFWMWWELFLTSVSTAFLVHRWLNSRFPGKPLEAWKGVAGVVASMAIGLSVGGLFGLLALQGDHVRLPDLPAYASARLPALAVLGAAGLLVHVMIAQASRLHRMTRQDIERPLTHRALAFLGAYLAAICTYHWTSSTTLEHSSGLQMILGCAVLGTKLLLELRWFHKAQNASPAGSSPAAA
jgi:hypothetical protein